MCQIQLFQAPLEILMRVQMWISSEFKNLSSTILNDSNSDQYLRQDEQDQEFTSIFPPPKMKGNQAFKKKFFVHQKKLFCQKCIDGFSKVFKHIHFFKANFSISAGHRPFHVRKHKNLGLVGLTGLTCNWYKKNSLIKWSHVPILFYKI